MTTDKELIEAVYEAFEEWNPAKPCHSLGMSSYRVNQRIPFEAGYKAAITAMQQHIKPLVDELTESMNMFTRMSTIGGGYPYINGTGIVSDAYRAASTIAESLANLPPMLKGGE